MEQSFSETTSLAVPTSTEGTCVESDSVSSLLDEDGDNTVIERLPFTLINIATGSNEVETSPSRNPLVRQDASNSTVQSATDSDCGCKSIAFVNGVELGENLSLCIKRAIHIAGLALS